MADTSYFFVSGTSWVVPTGVTAIKVECFGSNNPLIFNELTIGHTSLPQDNYPGASYSKSNNIAVTAGSTVYFNIGTGGGNSWFNTSNSVPTSSSSTSSACLAVGSSTAAGSQVASNCGDVKYAGGNGRVTTGFTLSAVGGAAGPNGPGADVGDPYTNTAKLLADGNSYLFCQGGGSNGGFQGSLGVPAYGRSGSGTAGMGARWNGSAYVNGTGDTTGSAKYIDNYALATEYTMTTYGGPATNFGNNCCCQQVIFLNGVYVTGGVYNPYNGRVVITIISATQKSLVFPGATGSFTIPADFSSLVSLEAVGGGGIAGGLVSGATGGGGGGGAYAKTNGASVTASMVAGSTVVYYSAGGWLRIGTNSIPTAVTDGVYAASGSSGSTNSGGAGGSSASSVGNIKYAGGAGGAGSTSSRLNYGGGGGAGGPLGAGANGGAADNTTPNTGRGGGGAANGGSVGSPGTALAGGNGGTITGGTGGAGAVAANLYPGAGTNGGGSGGSVGVYGIYNNNALSGPLNNSIYIITGGQGGGISGTSGYPSRGGGSITLDPNYYFLDPTNIANGAVTYGRAAVIFTYAISTDKTAALTGSASSASGGTLSPSQTLNQTLSGRSATASAGTLTNSQALTQALSGSVALASAGTLGTSTDQIVGLNSASANVYGGTLTNSQIVVQALTGVSASGQTSSFPANSDLVGVVASAGTGTLSYINTGWQLINTGGTVLWTDIDTQQT
jgi:hypothetical protein